MHQTVDAVLLPDGSLHLAEPLEISTPRRVLVTLLDEPLPGIPNTAQERLRLALHAAGLNFVSAHEPSATLPLSSDELAAFDTSIPSGRPLSELILEDREERF